MEIPRAISVRVPGPFRSQAVLDAARKIRESLSRPAGFAVAFVSPDYIPFLTEFVETLRVDGHISHVVGCTAAGTIEGAHEIEKAPGCAILAMACDAGEPLLPEAGGLFHPPFDGHPHGGILLADPFLFPTDDWLREWNQVFSGAPCVGGLASGGGEEDVAVFFNDRIVDAVAIPLCGTTGIIPVVSQGCRPIGEPLTVTRAEHNVVYSLGGQPAYEALELAFETLSDSEKSVAKGNLFAGIAGTEYVEDFKPGDFLIRNIIGADPGSGAVVIGGIPRTGQTLQYQFRERATAQADLERALTMADLGGRRPFATLLFSCLGRGSGCCGEPNHDALRVSRATGGQPLAGFFSNGEVGPVGGRNAVHGYTAAAAIWVEKVC